MLDRWESVLHRLGDDPMQLAGELDWVAKLELLEGYRDRDGLDWDAPRLQLVDLQYHDVRPEQGPVQPAGRARPDRAALDDAEVERGDDEPPEDTRAYFRGRCLRQVRRLGGRRVLGLGDLRRPGRESLQRVPRSSRCAAPRRTWATLLDRCRTAASW